MNFNCFLIVFLIGFSYGNEQKLSGGIVGTIKDFPYLISVQQPGIFGRRHVCGGAILNENWILTAAHCVSHFDDPRAYRILAGYNVGDTSESTDYSFAERHIHPEYSVNSESDISMYDVALLKTSTIISFKSEVNSIELDKNSTLADNTKGVLVGWGTNDYKEITISNIYSVELKALDKNDCKEKISLSINENTMCVAAVNETPAGLCFYDFVPFVVNKKLVAYGSTPASCAQTETPGLLTKISTIQEWINETINNNKNA